MDRKLLRNRQQRRLLPLLALVVTVPFYAIAQVPLDDDGNPIAPLDNDQLPIEEGAIADTDFVGENSPMTAVELEELVGPVALYPDDLLAIVLPASTYPLQIVQAARFLEQVENDGSLEPDESWDESVVALLNYPEVVQMLNENIDWTWRLGEAVISQQPELIAAVETFRDRAYAAGNLQTDEYQTVSNDEGIIEIEPVDDEIIYVPYYEPEEVVIYQPQPRRVYNYYPDAHPVYYYPYANDYRFGSHFGSSNFWGVTSAFTIGWRNNFLNVYHPSYYGHPFYGRQYFGNYYRRPSITVFNNWYAASGPNLHYNHYRDGNRWRPRNRSGARPVVTNRHYPPGDSDHVGNRTQVRRNGGRTDLGLRNRNTGRIQDNRFRGSRQTPAVTSNSNRARLRNNRTTNAGQRDNAAAAGRRDNDSRVGLRNRAADNRAGNRRTTADNLRRSGSNRVSGTQPDTRSRAGNRNTIADRLQQRTGANRQSNQRNRNANTPARPATRTQRRTSSDAARAARVDANRQRTTNANRRIGASNNTRRSTNRTAPTQNSNARATVRQRAPQTTATRRNNNSNRQQTVRRPAARPTPRQSAPRQNVPRQSAPRQTTQRPAPVRRAPAPSTQQRRAAPNSRPAAPPQSRQVQRREAPSRGNARQRRPR